MVLRIIIRVHNLCQHTYGRISKFILFFVRKRSHCISWQNRHIHQLCKCPRSLLLHASVLQKTA